MAASIILVGCKMALIPSESHSFPEHFVQDVAYARKAMRQPAPPPEPEPQKVVEPVKTEIQPKANRFRWWRMAGSRQAENDQAPAVVDDPIVEPGKQPLFQHRSNFQPAVNGPSVWVPAEQSLFSESLNESPMMPMLGQSQDWKITHRPRFDAAPAADVKQAATDEQPQMAVPHDAPVAEQSPKPLLNHLPVVEPAPETAFNDLPVFEEAPPPIFFDAPIVEEAPEPMVNHAPVIEQPEVPIFNPPPMAEISEPILNQAAELPPALIPPAPTFRPPHPVAPLPEIVDQPDQPAPKVFIPSLVPSTLKRKVRWNNRAPQTEQTPPPDGTIVNFHSNGAVPQPHAPPPAPVPPPMAKPKPDPRPRISLVPPPLEVTEPPSSPVVEQRPVAPQDANTRTVEAPSADLVQTLLARALFADPSQAPPPAEPQKPMFNFAPAARQPANGHVPRPAPEPKRMVERPQPVAREFTPPPSRIAERKRLKPKLRRFLVYEAIAVALLIPLAVAGILRVFHNPAMILVIDVVTIAAAVAATVMPILFFAVAPPLPRAEE